MTVSAAIAAVTLSVYLYRAWEAREERRRAPAPALPGVERQSSALAFSKVEKKQTIFTVRASRSTEYSANGENLLEDVQIMIFGREGNRHDTLLTRSCEYQKDSGNIRCGGEVKMELESAQDADRADASARRAHVETSSVTFDRDAGVAQTGEPVTFTLPRCQGQAVGANYNSDSGVLRLARDVKLYLELPGTPGASGALQAAVSGSSLEYRRNSRRLLLSGPVQATIEGNELTAGEISLDLDANLRAQKLIAEAGQGGARPVLHSKQPGGEMQMAADQVVAEFHPEGWLEALSASGHLEGEFPGDKQSESFHSEKGVATFWPRSERLKEMEAMGNVALEGNGQNGLRRRLETDGLRVAFSEPDKNNANYAQFAETLGVATMEWSEAGKKGTKVSTRLSADVLRARFAASGRAEEVEAAPNVRLEQHSEGQPNETAAAQSGTARFASDGNWSEVDLKGEVHLDESAAEEGGVGRSARADAAAFVRAAQSATLEGNAVASDSVARTTARRISFEQATGEIRADGAVRTTELDAGHSGVDFEPQAANLSADHLEANSQTGCAIYSGHARLWQGNTLIEADTIELLRQGRALNARGRVRAEFPQTARPGQKTAGAQSPVTWRVRTESLSYRDQAGMAHLEKGVQAQSSEGQIQAAALDLYFTGTSGQGRQVSRAAATGGVEVRQGERRATAEQGEYNAAEEKFVLQGGNPTITDASRGTTTGRQLTFYSAGDTIIVESEDGSRTLTKHRVEK
jgi:lipopolysaccharide export system protein LptA